MNGYRSLPYDKMDGVMWDLNFEIPAPCMVSFFREVDMSSAEILREDLAGRGEPKPSYTSLVVRAIAMAMPEFPYANRRVFRWPLHERVVQFEDVNISVAVERESVMHSNPETLYRADTMSLPEIQAQLDTIRKAQTPAGQRWESFRRLVNRVPGFLAKWLAAVPRFFPSLWLEHRGGSVLVTSPAKYGVDAISGFWHWPVTFSFGLVKPRPVAAGNRVVVRPTTILSMVFDRRIMAGAPAARFFDHVASLIERADTAMNERSEAETSELHEHVAS